MMDAFKGYILAVVAVCLTISVIQKLTGDRTGAAVIRVICGVVLTVTVISPLARLKISNLSQFTDYVQADADALVQDGTKRANQQMRDIITQEVTAYILEKASLYDCSIASLEVVLSQEAVPVPDTLRINGLFSPNAKKNLTEIFEGNLGIPKEKQQWTYQS